MKNNKLKNFSKTVYSNDKAYLNAIITTNSTFAHKKKGTKGSLRFLMYLYAFVILLVILVSLGMLFFDSQYQQSHQALFTIIEGVVFIVLSLDFIIRWYTAEVRIKKGNWSYFLFPFTITGILLLASLFPSLYLINIWTNSNFKIFNVFESMKFLRIFRIILLANLVPGISLFRRVLIKEKSTLYTVLGLVMIVIILFSLVLFNIEEGVNTSGLKIGDKGFNKNDPIQIKTYWDAFYFTTITLTTIGFGDISPHTTTGRVLVMIMAILGVAILAIPSGVIAGGFISELKIVRKEKAHTKKTW